MKCKTRQLRFVESCPVRLNQDDRRHLSVCRECREFLADLESLERRLSDLPPPEPPLRVDTAILNEARARPAAGADGWPLPFGSFSIPARFGALAAAAVVLLLFSLWMLWRTPLPKDGVANGLTMRPEAGEALETPVEKALTEADLEAWLTDFEQELWLLEAEMEAEHEALLMIGQLWYAEVY